MLIHASNAGLNRVRASGRGQRSPPAGPAIGDDHLPIGIQLSFLTAHILRYGFGVRNLVLGYPHLFARHHFFIDVHEFLANGNADFVFVLIKVSGFQRTIASFAFQRTPFHYNLFAGYGNFDCFRFGDDFLAKLNFTRLHALDMNIQLFLAQFHHALRIQLVAEIRVQPGS